VTTPRPGGSSVQAVVAHRLRMAPMPTPSSNAARRSPRVSSVPWVLDLVDCLTTTRGRSSSGRVSLDAISRPGGTRTCSRRRAHLGGSLGRLLEPCRRRRKGTWCLGRERGPTLDAHEWGRLGDRTQGRRPKEYPPDRKVVAFVGNLGYAPNEDGALCSWRSVWPIIRQKCPEAFFRGGGGGPSKRLLRRHNGQDILVRGICPRDGSLRDPCRPDRGAAPGGVRIPNKVALSLRSHAGGGDPPGLEGTSARGREGPFGRGDGGVFRRGGRDEAPEAEDPPREGEAMGEFPSQALGLGRLGSRPGSPDQGAGRGVEAAFGPLRGCFSSNPTRCPV
jgi:hypothetical protein